MDWLKGRKEKFVMMGIMFPMMDAHIVRKTGLGDVVAVLLFVTPLDSVGITESKKEKLVMMERGCQVMDVVIVVKLNTDGIAILNLQFVKIFIHTVEMDL